MPPIKGMVRAETIKSGYLIEKNVDNKSINIHLISQVDIKVKIY